MVVINVISFNSGICKKYLHRARLGSVQQRITALQSLVAELHKSDRLRERVRKANLLVQRSRRIGRRKQTLH
jgi:hypothetical protein